MTDAGARGPAAAATNGAPRTTDEVFVRLARAMREAAWELSLGVVEEGLRAGTVASLGRVPQADRLGELPAFIGELGRQIVEPQAGRVRPDTRLAEVARDHARHRESIGFAPREVVMELLVLRNVLWRFLAERRAELAEGDLLAAERRLEETLDTIVVECVAGYFDRATTELSDRARRDPLTRLLNREAFWNDLERELDRARRYGHGLSFVFVDLDWFKQINDTRGHPVGDRVLQCVAECLDAVKRGSDLAGRMGGDEFAVALVETDRGAGDAFVERLAGALHELSQARELADEISFSAGTAHFPSEAENATALFELADTRLYERKRSR